MEAKIFLFKRKELWLLLSTRNFEEQQHFSSSNKKFLRVSRALVKCRRRYLRAWELWRRKAQLRDLKFFIRSAKSELERISWILFYVMSFRWMMVGFVWKLGQIIKKFNSKLLKLFLFFLINFTITFLKFLTIFLKFKFYFSKNIRVLLLFIHFQTLSLRLHSRIENSKSLPCAHSTVNF